MMEETLSEAAKRMSSEVTMHAVLGNYGKWAAFALADGSSDHVAYDTRSDAISHQHHNEDRYTFILIPPAGMTLGEGMQVLTFWRLMRDAGYRATDPQLAMPLTKEDQKRQIGSIKR